MRVVSCDPLYSFDRGQIEHRVFECHDDLIAQVCQQQDGFVWTQFRNPKDCGRHRLQVMRRFLADFDTGKAEGRYVTASLPSLPFGTGEFDLALVSHFLLLYSGLFDLEFHWDSIVELMRVASEVRIFPLLTLAGTRSPHVEPLLNRLNASGWEAKIQTVPYEFQRGGNEMLQIRKSN